MGRRYDRVQMLAAASKAQARGRARRAVRLLRCVLQFEPGNGELHFRIAPLLARTGRRFEAWESFQAAAASLVRQKQEDGAAAVYAEATRCLPACLDAWRCRARHERRRGRDAQAIRMLIEARTHFRGRRTRGQAIALLKEAREIDPWDTDCVLDLARLLSRHDQADEARRLLSGMAERTSGRALRSVNSARFRLDPSVTHLWQWLRAAVAALRADEVAAPVAAQRSAMTPSGARR